MLLCCACISLYDFQYCRGGVSVQAPPFMVLTLPADATSYTMKANPIESVYDNNYFHYTKLKLNDNGSVLVQQKIRL